MARRSGMLAVSGACLVAVAVLVLLVDFHNFMDLRVYCAGGQAFLDGFDLYADEFARRYDTGLPFTYPPPAALLFTTLAVVPAAVAVAALTAVSLGAIAAVAVLVVRKPVTLVAAAFAFGVVLEPVRLTLSYGQINLVLMVLVVADCLLPRTWWPRGALIGLAAAVKLTPFAFLLFFVAHRQWRPAFTAVGAFAALSVVVWVLAPSDTPAYLSTVLGDPTRIGDLAYAGNQSLNAMWHRFGLGDGATTALWLASALAVAGLGWAAVRRSRAAGDDLGALLAAAIAGLLASPVSWSHHWVWAMLAGVWLVPRLREWQWPGRIAAVAGLLVFVAPPHWVLPNRHDRELTWSWWQHLVGNEFSLFGLVLLIVLARPTAVLLSRRRTPAAAQARAPRS